MAPLTMEQVARENNGDTSSVTSLQLTHRALSDVSCLSKLAILERVDLGFNCLSSLEGLSSCISLKWLSVAENKLESLKGIEKLTNLTVLNAGKNKLKSMEEIRSATSLRALILNDNKIFSICKLDHLKHLNTLGSWQLKKIYLTKLLYTNPGMVYQMLAFNKPQLTKILVQAGQLVLSRNPISKIGDALENSKSMTKLSLSGCQIEKIGASLVSCAELKELRLAHNNISSIPSDLSCNTKIQLLDLGNNSIERYSDLKVLAGLPNLKNLNLHGNPISNKDNLAYKVKKLVTNLRIFNAKPMELNISKSTSRNVAPEINSPKETKTKHKFEKNGNAKTNPEKKSANSNPELNDAAESKKEKKKKSAKNEEKKHGDEKIDDADIPFLDVILSESDNNNTLNSNKKKRKDQEKLVGAFVVDHTKKNKKERGKTAFSGPLAIKLLSPPPDIGTGGSSTWD